MIVDSLKHHVGFPGDSVVNNLPAMQETRVWSLDQEDPLEWKVATHPVFLPGEFYGQRSLVGYHLWVSQRVGYDWATAWGCNESDMTEWLIWSDLTLFHTSLMTVLMVNKLREHGSWWKSVQFSSVAQSCSTLWEPMDRSLPVHHQLLEFTQVHVHWAADATQWSHSLLFPPPPAFNLSKHQGLFKINI